MEVPKTCRSDAIQEDDDGVLSSVPQVLTYLIPAWAASLSAAKVRDRHPRWWRAGGQEAACKGDEEEAVNGAKDVLQPARVWPTLIGWLDAGPGPKSRSKAGDFQEQDWAREGPGNQAWVPPPSPRRGFSPVGSGPTACFGETFTASASGLPQSPYNPPPFLQIHAPCLEAARSLDRRASPAVMLRRGDAD